MGREQERNDGWMVCERTGILNDTPILIQQGYLIDEARTVGEQVIRYCTRFGIWEVELRLVTPVSPWD